ncbi:MAG: class I SAM-dependent methyltransferase [Polyangiaceae bacterium]|nr:class I SAM-dependent methyltransferase [Polyangiaceae bacterium]
MSSRQQEGSGPARPAFDYSAIPEGYYDAIAREGNPVRRLWHLSKFERVIDALPVEPGQSLLDIGCFAGTFLSMLDGNVFTRQVGVDILPAQVDYANRVHGRDFRRFQHIVSLKDLGRVEGTFSCVTLIEVIEHLDPVEIGVVLAHAARLLEPGGRLVITTPNYSSAWPIIELFINAFSDLSYREQHITKFYYANMESKIESISPGFLKQFTLERKTTTHLVSPFLAAVSFRGARALSRMVPPRLWRVPVGSLILSVFRRTDVCAD